MTIANRFAFSLRQWVWFGFRLLGMSVVRSQPAAQNEAVGDNPQPSKRPLRVAYLHFTLQRGGVERHIMNLVRSLDPSRVQASVVLTRTNASLALLPAVSAYAYSVVSFPASRPTLDGNIVRDSDGFQALVNYLQRSQFDVAFSFVMGGVDDLVGLDAAALAAVPVSIAYVGWTISISPGLPIDALELPSDMLVDLQPPGSGYQLARINSPMDLEVFSMARFKPRNQHMLKRVVVGRVSRLVLEKNPQTFILVAAEVKKYYNTRYKEDPDATILLPRFVLAGDGPLMKELVELAETYDVSDIVEFIGAVEADLIPDLLASFDIFLYPTFGDSFGYVVAEALAMELPVVATSVGSIPELVDESNGFLVKPSFQSSGNAQIQVIDERYLGEMTDRVLKLISDPDLRSAMGSRGRARLYKSGMTMQEFGNTHAHLYEILHGKSLASNFSSNAGYHARVDATEWASLVQPRAPPTREMSPPIFNAWWGTMDEVGIYVINLDRSPDRLKTFLSDAADHGLDAENICRISAVDGRYFSERTEQRANSSVVDATLDYHSRGAKEQIKDSIADFSVRCLDLRYIGPLVKWEAGNIAVTLSHLKAIRTAFDRGDEVALIFEDDTVFDDDVDGLRSSGDFAAILDAAAQLDPEWAVLQLGHLTGDDTNELERLAEAWKRGLLLVPRMPCGNADWRIYGLHAYVIHRRGMALLLESWWPGGVGEDSSGAITHKEKFTCSSPPAEDRFQQGVSGLSGLSFDLRLAGRAFSESIVLNLPGVYVVTRPLFMQRHDVTSDTDHYDNDKHVHYHESNSRQARAKAYSTSGGEYYTARARGVEFPPPALDTINASPPVDYYVWLANEEILFLEEFETHGPPWPHPNFQCESYEHANHAVFCASMGAILRELRNVCLPSGLIRTSSYFDGELEDTHVSVARRPVASVLDRNQRLMVLLYPVAGQPQVAVFTSQDVHPATRRLTARELAVEYCSRDAQLPSHQCDQLHYGFEAAIKSFAESLVGAN